MFSKKGGDQEASARAASISQGRARPTQLAATGTELCAHAACGSQDRDPLAQLMAAKAVIPDFKNKTRYAPYVSLRSQISHIATNKG